METANNASMPDLEPENTDLQQENEKESEAEVGVPEEKDRELSWEKIAAEIAEDVDTDKNQEALVDEVVEETEENESEEGATNQTQPEAAEQPQIVDEAEKPLETTDEANKSFETTEEADKSIETSEEAETSLEKTTEEADETSQVVEISELKPDEAPEVSEEVEYSVMEAEEVETNEIIEEHLAQSSNGKGVTETVVIINPDQSQTEITIQQIDEDDRNEENSNTYTEAIYLVTKDNEDEDDPAPKKDDEVKAIKPKKPRGRKPITDIPLHVLGRDISKPIEGVSNGGRTMPKPRLGVKVPYKNLTSQIVSKQEIEKEIMERFKLKQEQNINNSGDIMFARRLTQRLAKKLIPTEKDKSSTNQESSEASASTTTEPEKSQSDIKNNSDLLAILEGDGDDIELSKKELKKTEREIALEQLKELPGKPTKIQKDEKKPTPSNQETPKLKVAPSNQETSKVKVTSSNQETPKVKVAPSNQETPKIKVVPSNVQSDKKPVDMEPRLKTGMVIKTYTRKRKSTDMMEILPLKKTLTPSVVVKSDDSSSVYVTKSSRIIKRKVIWDPDEIPNKNLVKSPKAAGESVKNDKNEKVKTPSPIKKVSKSPTPKKPKRLTEVDRLLMDEGAVNMLYDVKTNDETKKKTNKSVISLDKAHKELMSKTNVIKNDLQQHTNKDVQKSLRKKEIISPTNKKKESTPSAITRKKSKDSSRSSPPASPPYAAEASRIIRRHSSSSFSSNDEADDDDDDDDEESQPKKKVESPKKKIKKETKLNNNENHKAINQYKTFTATKKNKLVGIKFRNVEGRCYLNQEVLNELIGCLNEFGDDDDCHVVSITSDCNESFCDGLDYSLLIVEDETARKKIANEMASLVKEFLRCLLNFPKVLIAGIQGDCVGLGVTMLPLFDMVIASDTSTFTTPYARLGSIPEAGFLLTVPYLSNNGLASELLYTSQIIKADDAFRRGLVSRLCWPEKYQQELKSLLQQVASQSLGSLMATKKQLRSTVLSPTEDCLSSMSKVLVEYWTSGECQKSFASK